MLRSCFLLLMLAATSPAAATEWIWARSTSQVGPPGFRAAIAGEQGVFEFGCYQGSSTWIRVWPNGYVGYSIDGTNIRVTTSVGDTILDQREWLANDHEFFTAHLGVGRLLHLPPGAEVRFVIQMPSTAASIDMRFDLTRNVTEILREASQTCSLNPR